MVICTRGRPAKLRRTLASMARPDGPAPDTEVLIVDNGPSEATRKVVEAFREVGPLRFRYLVERSGGASRARNLGIRQSRGSLVAFVDDDCLVDASWLAAMVHEFARPDRPDVVGGRVELHDERDAAVTVRRATERRICDWTEVFFSVPGCNFCVRRDVLSEIGGFDERMGPGAPLQAAEDADLLFRAHRAGARVLYSPRPAVRHDHGRRTPNQVAEVQRRYVTGRGGFYCKHFLRGDLDVLRLAYWEVRECLGILVGSRQQPDTVLGPVERLTWLARGAFRWIASLLRDDPERTAQISVASEAAGTASRDSRTKGEVS